MTITQIHVKSIDNSSKYLISNRSIQIKTTKNDILTPIRASTDSEYRQKAIIPTDLPIENPVSITIEELNANQFNKFMTDNAFFERILRRVELKARLAEYCSLSLTLLKLTKSDYKNRATGERCCSPMALLKQNPDLLERFLRVIIRLQQESGLSPISIPFIDLPFSQYADTVKQVAKTLAKIDQQPVFFLDMNYRDFDKALHLMIKI
jgi:hypothetical protein